MSKRLIVISAHPDDEILGVGGTLIRNRDSGTKLGWIIGTNILNTDIYPEERIIQRQKEIYVIAKNLKSEVFKLNYETTHLSSSDLVTMVPKISEIFKTFKPDTIYILNRSDNHSDHRIVFDAVMACTKSFRYPFIREILMYECISETEFAPALRETMFIPNCFVDISNQMEEKLNLINIYNSEIGVHPFPRSIENIKALATFRGSTIGVKYAEAFQIIKSIKIESL